MTTAALGGPPPGPVSPESPGPCHWVSAHLYYQGSIDRLLTGAVAPLVTEFRGRGWAEDYFFLRYWDGGSHLRLRVLPRPGHEDRLRSLVAERCARYFREHPSEQAMTPGQYRDLAATWAAGEGVAGYARELHANNALEFASYQREHERYGYGQALSACERHFVEASEIALAVVGAGGSPGARATIGTAVLIASWVGSGIADPAAAGHVPAPLTGWRPATPRRGTVLAEDDLPTRFAAQRHRLVELTRRVRDGTFTSAAVTAWTRSVQHLHSALAAEAAAGRYRPGSDPTWPADSEAATPQAAVMPVLDMCAHLMCNRLGIVLPEEFYLRYLAARALEEIR